MKITGTFEAFKEFVNHLPHRGAGIFLYQVGVGVNKTKVTKILVEDREWDFRPTDQPLVEWVRTYSNAAIEVDDWTL